ncbi:uncharacterized protein LOC135837285 isoform X1 [Planococcus citri]|uniref:uncharacterized protein LOC135837285 isoform X1 n=1 Tax=Planococcus citri TaxID=170843 RepID=UPI0031F745E8
MKCNIKFLFCVLFLTKEITSIRASYSTSKKSDITKYLNSTIHKIFRSAKSVALTCLLKKIQNHEPKTYEYNLTRKVQGFRDQIVFRNVTFPSLWSDELATKYMEYDFLNNRIQIGLDRVHIECHCDIYVFSDNGTTYRSIFWTGIVFGDYEFWKPRVDNTCIINLTKLPKTNLENTFTIDMRIPDSSNIGYRFHYSWNHNKAVAQNNDLMEEIKSKLPSVLLENMNHNEKLIQALNNSYGFRPKRHLLAKRKNFSHNEYQYHYRIPTAKYFCFKLINISISGMSNFQSLKHYRSPDKKPIHTLWIKDIRGNATLDYGRESESPLELNFHAEYLSISRDRFTGGYYGRGFKVATHWASVSRAKEDIPLTIVHSECIWRSIESALAFSLKPESIVDEMETPLKPKCSEIPSSLSWEDMKQSYEKWIPFNDD